VRVEAIEGAEPGLDGTLERVIVARRAFECGRGRIADMGMRVNNAEVIIRYIMESTLDNSKPRCKPRSFGVDDN
jgi:hypothetical protein